MRRSVIAAGTTLVLSGPWAFGATAGPHHQATQRELRSGGIVLLGGDPAERNRVVDLVISNNEVRTDLVGINLVGGAGEPVFTEQASMSARDNLVSDVEARCNHVLLTPQLVNPYDNRVESINLVGGLGRSMGNRVECRAGQRQPRGFHR